MKKLKQYISLVLSVLMVITSISVNPLKTEAEVQNTTTLLDNTATWRYLDDNTDPAGSGDRTSWAENTYDDSAWKTGIGKFGSKSGSLKDLGNGFTADVLLTQYIDGTTTDIPTYFFRSTFTIDNLDDFSELSGELQYDDAAIVYINGVEVAGFDVPTGGYTTNLECGGSNAGDPKTGTFTVTNSAILFTGENVISVELHQGRNNSSDIFMNFKSLNLIRQVNETAADNEINAPEDSNLVSVTQKAITLNVGADETERNITWYADDAAAGGLELAKASDMSGTEFPEDKSVTYTAAVKATNDSGFYSNQLTMTNLTPATDYIYRLVNGNTISDTYRFKTGTEGDFSFLFAGDPQIGAGSVATDITGWDNTLTKAINYFNDVDFIASAGDQVNTAGDENQYTGFLNHDVLKSTPIATVVGNHDSANAAYSQHFNNPNITAYGITTAGSDYWYVYNHVLFMNLNSNNLSTAEHKAFMEAAIAANPKVDWKIVVFHHSIYSVANHATESDILQRRQELAPVFKDLDIDVVLMGHDHVYVRTYMMDGLTPTVQKNTDGSALSSVTDPEGTLYVTANSASGSKFYTIQNQTFPYAAVQNQENTPNISHVEVTNRTFKITTYRVNDMSVVDSFEINHTVDTGTKPYTKTSDKIDGVKNGTAALAISKAAAYDSGVVNEDGGSAEIVKYNTDNDNYYVVNGTTGNLDIVPREIYEEGVNEVTALGKSINLKAKLESMLTGFTYGDMTSVDVNTSLDVIAVGVQGAGTNEDSVIVFLSYDGNIIKTVTAGKQVDMVTFTKDGKKLLGANEGEPRDGYAAGTTDPKGSVTIVDLTGGLDNAASTNVTFDNMDAERANLVADGVIIKKNTNPSVDFEPEYIAVSEDGKYAYVSLQEANAIATLDLTTNEFTTVKSLGFKNHNLTGNALDLMKDNQINIASQNVYGIYMPDGIAVYNNNGKTYLVTANEGDSRAWGDYTNEVKAKINGVSVTTFATSDYDGVDPSKTYIFGGRSFSIYDAATMEQIYDSGSDFESITANALPANFNASNNNITLDDRSGKKGPEPENVVVGTVGDSKYAFIGLERIGGIMIYDITNPKAPAFVNYINSRDFGAAIAGDDSPEGLCFVDAANSISGVAEVLAAFEVSGTVGIYEVKKQAGQPTTPTPEPTTTPTPTTPPTVTPTPTPSSGNSSNGGSPSSTPTPTPTEVPVVKDVSKLSVTLSQDTYTYSGMENTPSVTVNDGTKTLNKGSDYSVTYHNNINVGTGTVTISGAGKYKGSAVETFIINPKSTSLRASKVTTTSNTLVWTEVSGVTGYDIYSYHVSTSGFEKIKSLDKIYNSYEVSEMDPGTSYQYKIRTYQIVDGKKYYSEYSEALFTATKPLAPVLEKTGTDNIGKGKAVLNWKKISGVSGYQIYMTTKKDGKFTKASTVKGADTVTYSKSKLKSGKTYYFKVRAYRSENGKTYFSSFSKVISVKL